MTKEDIEKELIYNFAGSESELKAIADWVYTLLEKENNSLRLENEKLDKELCELGNEYDLLEIKSKQLKEEINSLLNDLKNYSEGIH